MMMFGMFFLICIPLINAVWDISDYVYDEINISTQGVQPYSIFFSQDGTKLYELDIGIGLIYQYSCSVGWDLSSCSYDEVNISGQGGVITGIFFKFDGTKMYEISYGWEQDLIRQSSLSSAWDLSTASYDFVSISTQDTQPKDLFFSSDGTKLYEIGDWEDLIYQYSCSVGWDLSSCSYDSINFNVSSLCEYPSSLFFKSDGIKMYISDEAYDIMYQYSLSSAWNLSSVLYDNISFWTYGSSIGDFFIKFDGSKLYVIKPYEDYEDNGVIYQYSLIEEPSFISVFSGEIQGSGNLYDLMRGFGAGLGLFFTYLALGLPLLLIGLALVVIIIIIGMGIRDIIKGTPLMKGLREK